jgi:hypothetical protein
MIPIYLRHKNCGRELSIAVLQHDAAIYVYCEHCHDLVEDGEIDPPIDEDKVRLRVDEARVRPMLTDGESE